MFLNGCEPDPSSVSSMDPAAAPEAVNLGLAAATAHGDLATGATWRPHSHIIIVTIVISIVICYYYCHLLLLLSLVLSFVIIIVIIVMYVCMHVCMHVCMYYIYESHVCLRYTMGIAFTVMQPEVAFSVCYPCRHNL